VSARPSNSIALGAALDDLVDAVAALAPACRPRRAADGAGDAVAVGQLAHLDAVGAQHHAALRDDGVADQHHDVALHVDAARLVGLDDPALAAVGLLGLHAAGRREQGRGEQAGGKAEAGHRLSARNLQQFYPQAGPPMMAMSPKSRRFRRRRHAAPQAP